MADQNEGMDSKTPAPAKPAGGTATAPRRPGHRGMDAREAMAEMAARAQEISLEAGSKVGAALKDVINAAAGVAGFAVESARDVVQYMVRRGQMTQDEADKLIRAAEEAHVKHGGTRPAPPPPRVDPARTSGVLPFASSFAATPAIGVPAVAKPPVRAIPVDGVAKRPAAVPTKAAAPKVAKPVTASKPLAAAKPVAAAKPAKPSRPVKVAKPGKAAKPAKPAKSVKAAKTKPAKASAKKKGAKKR
ncbi:MAG: hypothetical protein NVS9B3_09760 [Gemmatimonadaceae bacterium]